MVKVIGHEAKRLLADVPDEYVFYLNDGRILKNMENLRDALNAMSDELFAYHVNSAKNDFSNWVRDIMNDEKLAKDLLKTSNRLQSFKVLSQRVAFLRNRMP